MLQIAPTSMLTVKRIRELCFVMRLIWEATIKATFHTDMNGDIFFFFLWGT